MEQLPPPTFQAHALTAHAHLQLSHTTPLQERLKQINKLFSTHPLLGQKTARIAALAADRPIENKEHIAHLANILVNHERELWSNVRIHAERLEAHTLTQKDLEETERKHIQDNAAAVKNLCAEHFARLTEFALISKEKTYNTAHQDYQRFMAVVGAGEQLVAMQELLEQQHFMLRKLDAKLNLDASRVTPLIQDIQLSFQDQQALAARLPPFSFK